MIYSFVRPIAAYALKIFFRKIYFTNRDRIPKGKPLILAINHPTAFIEPCILACFLPIKLHFLVRGDLFKKPLFIYCKSGGRSAKAVEKATEMGFKRIIELDGGMETWKDLKTNTQHGI